jgi:D-alanine-D-alanine ligase
MRVGLTYDLRDDYRALGGFSEEALAEFDSEETVAALEGAIRAMGHQTDRIGHIRELARRLVEGERWDLVFNFAEGIAGRSREAQVPALLEAYGVPYVMSDPLTQAVGLDKAMAKRLVREAGVATAPFAVLDGDADALGCTLAFPVFAKPVAEGTGKGCAPTSKAATPTELMATARTLRAKFAQPVIVEPYLPGREFTVGIVGTGAGARALGVLEIVLRDGAEPGIYSYDNKELCESRVDYLLVDDAEARAAAETALAAYRALDCRDAARVDLRSDAAGVPQFLEVNTLPGLHPTHSDLPILATQVGLGYDRLIAEIVAAACARLGLATQRSAA